MDRVEYQPLLIQDLINLHRLGELDLNPWYQRRAVWTRPQKAYLINTLFECMPIPSLYIRHSLDLEKEKSIKEVVDGQQRIRALLEFVDEGFSVRHPEHQRRVRYGQLTRSQKQSFRMTSLSVGYLVGATDSDVIEIFGRLNSVSKTLNPQEKRNANYSGAFKQFCLKQAAKRLRLWRDLRIFTANNIARMQEVQFVSELAINMTSGLTDYSAKQINQTYRENDESFDREEEIGERMETVFTLIAQLSPESVRDTIFSRSPLFFSLFLILDSVEGIEVERLESILYTIDRNFNSDIPISERSREDADFYVACTNNLHRIRSRRIRDSYIRSYF
jgi:hypothetical protein